MALSQAAVLALLGAVVMLACPPPGVFPDATNAVTAWTRFGDTLHVDLGLATDPGFGPARPSA